MSDFANTLHKFRQLPRKQRNLLIVAPLIFVGAIDAIKAYRHREMFELVAVIVIFFIVVPFAAVRLDRFMHDNNR